MTKPLHERRFRLDAYYYSFDPTGSKPIDAVLCAVAWAGKMYHLTEDWGSGWPKDDEEEPTEAERIQSAANAAAAEVAALETAARALVEALPRCDNGCGSVALNEVHEAQGTAWQYGCDECLKREHWGYCDVDWAPQLRALLRLLGDR